MGVAERREREREHLRSQIVDAARDLLLEQGLSGLSMRAIAERIEYSPATIYLYFRDKDELVREVVHTGFELMRGVVWAELAAAGGGASAADQHTAMGRAYARFAVENPAYFRVMFELPATAELCAPPDEHVSPDGLTQSEELVSRAVAEGQIEVTDPRRAAIIGWGLIHGLTTLFLSGHLRGEVSSPDEFIQLIEDAMQSIYAGWRTKQRGEWER